MESSILSEVDNTSDSQDGLSTRLLLSSQLATNLSALAPAKRAGAQRLCALAHLRHAGMSAPCRLSRAKRTRSARSVLVGIEIPQRSSLPPYTDVLSFRSEARTAPTSIQDLLACGEVIR